MYRNKIYTQMEYSKDGITVAVVLDKTHPKKNGLYPVRIRVTYRRQRQYYLTGKDLTLEQWERIPLTRNRDLKAIRESIANSFDIVRQNVDELAAIAGFSFDALNARLKSGSTDTVNTAFRAKIADLNEQNRIGNAIVYDNVLKGLERFAGDKIRFDAVTVEWVKKYERFLHSEDKTTSTIGILCAHSGPYLTKPEDRGLSKNRSTRLAGGVMRYRPERGENWPSRWVK